MNNDVIKASVTSSEYAVPVQWAPWLQRGLGGKHRRPRRNLVQMIKGMPAFPRRTLKYDGPGTPIMNGMDVERWQRQACKKGYTLRVDGWYGPRSCKVAKCLQERAGITADGEIDALTWAATWN
ncbi:peptidoglycan-binding domain-containing protein [Actinomadura formosensis]|uniref:peptidoglycan-binding domain-containing protein n=1 Tax=Actinomadura formosensis TaxID=60706 RepID=UPI000830FD58|nr:peptidoglycan-binding protein [Actinomadura formosensis]